MRGLFRSHSSGWNGHDEVTPYPSRVSMKCMGIAVLSLGRGLEIRLSQGVDLNLTPMAPTTDP